MATDIKVKLTPEGVKEVVAALRLVQTEAEAASRKANGGFLSMTASLETFKALLPTLGFAAVVAGIKSTTTHITEMFDEAGKAAQRIGATSEEISTLNFAAKTADVSTEELEKSLSRLAKNVGGLRAGVGDSSEAFAQLGLHAKDFDKLDTAQAFALLSSRLGKLPDGIDKTRLALELLGKGGQRLIPLINDIATKGFDAVAEEAAHFGAVITTESAQAAQVFNDNLTLMEVGAGKLSRTLVGDLLPGLNEITRAMLEAAKDGGLLNALFVGLGGAASVLFNGTETAQAQKELATLEAAAAQTRKFIEEGKVKVPFLPFDIKLSEKALADAQGVLDKQVKAVADARFKLDELTKPKALKKGPGEDFEDLSNFNAQSKLAELTKKAASDELKQLEDVSKRRQSLALENIKQEQAAVEARLVLQQHLLSGQQALDAATFTSYKARLQVAQDTYTTEVEIANARQVALSALISKNYKDSKVGQALQAEATKQSIAVQLSSAQTYYAKLVELQGLYLTKYKTASLAIKAIDDEVANNKLGREKFFTDLSRQGLTDKQKYNAAIRDADDKESQLRDAVLAGDLDKARKYRDELVALAKEVAQSRGDGVDEARAQNLGKNFYDRADELLNLALSQKKFAETANKVTADEGAKSLTTQIAEAQKVLDDFNQKQLAGINLKVTVDNASLRSLVDEIKDELGKTIFPIKIQPDVQTFSSGGPVGYAEGGPIAGTSPTPTADDKLIFATSGEFMQPVNAVKHYGRGFMESVRTMQFPRFADGGMVGGTSNAAPGEVHHVDLTSKGKSIGRLSGPRDTVRGFVKAINEVARGTTK